MMDNKVNVPHQMYTKITHKDSQYNTCTTHSYEILIFIHSIFSVFVIKEDFIFQHLCFEC